MKTFKEFLNEAPTWELSRRGVLEVVDGDNYFWVKKVGKDFEGVLNNDELEFDTIEEVKKYIDSKFKIPTKIWADFVKLVN